MIDARQGLVCAGHRHSFKSPSPKRDFQSVIHQRTNGTIEYRPLAKTRASFFIGCWCDGGRVFRGLVFHSGLAMLAASGWAVILYRLRSRLPQRTIVWAGEHSKDRE